MEETIIGFLFGVFMASFLTMIICFSYENSYWETEAMARGYGHMELDHSFHWNNEKK